MLEFVIEGSGAISYLRRDLLDRPPAIISSAPTWVPAVPSVNTFAISTSIVFSPPPAKRYLSTTEQRVFRAALRRSVQIISTNKPKA
jgi:hypothetical protein